MFNGPVGPVEVFFYWPEAVFWGKFYWPGAIGSPLASSLDLLGSRWPTRRSGGWRFCHVCHFVLLNSADKNPVIVRSIAPSTHSWLPCLVVPTLIFRVWPFTFVNKSYPTFSVLQNVFSSLGDFNLLAKICSDLSNVWTNLKHCSEYSCIYLGIPLHIFFSFQEKL